MATFDRKKLNNQAQTRKSQLNLTSVCVFVSLYLCVLRMSVFSLPGSVPRPQQKINIQHSTFLVLENMIPTMS